MSDDYGARVRAAQAFAGLDDPTMAAALGVSTRTLARAKDNERELTIREAVQLAETTGVPLDFLTQGWSGETRVMERLETIAQSVEDLARELLVREREGSGRSGEDDRPASGSQPAPPL